MDDRDELACRWPQFALSISVDGALLVAPTDAELAELARQAAAPGAVLPEPRSHFVTWLRGRTPGEIERELLEGVGRHRDLTRRPGWTLDLAIIVDGTPVGMQSLSGFERWPDRRVVGTSSWLLSTSQRVGLGTRSRAAVLDLAFVHLNAERARSWALEENLASTTVSTRLGYTVVDRRTIVEDGTAHTELVHELSRDDWLRSSARRRIAPRITGVEGLRGVLSS